MKQVFLILPVTIGLSACVGGTMTADLGPCKPVADQPGSAVLFDARLGSEMLLLTRDVHSVGRIKFNEAATTACTRIQDDKNQKPRDYDLHKIGDGPVFSGVLLSSSVAKPSCPKAHA